MRGGVGSVLCPFKANDAMVLHHPDVSRPPGILADPVRVLEVCRRNTSVLY